MNSLVFQLEELSWIFSLVSMRFTRLMKSRLKYSLFRKMSLNPKISGSWIIKFGHRENRSMLEFT
ncbi:hypothetical protein D3C72_1362760 [compost metagenome]